MMIRSAHGIELTAAGRVFLDHARQALAQVDASREAARRAAQPAKQSFALGFLTGKEIAQYRDHRLEPGFSRPRGCSCQGQARRGVPPTRNTGDRSDVQGRRHRTVRRRVAQRSPPRFVRFLVQFMLPGFMWPLRSHVMLTGGCHAAKVQGHSGACRAGLRRGVRQAVFLFEVAVH